MLPPSACAAPASSRACALCCGGHEKEATRTRNKLQNKTQRRIWKNNQEEYCVPLRVCLRVVERLERQGALLALLALGHLQGSTLETSFFE
jgi:hypothetical protein